MLIPKHLNFDIIFHLSIVVKMTQKTIVDLVEILLARKRAWNVDTDLKLIIGNTELGVVKITGKIEYIPSDSESKAAQIT